ncbi:hypothetical protein GOODEAATRI_031814, partial [Goodea atripinnis]
IDTSVIGEIEDVYLARYIPVYGDRIATRRYCLDKQKRQEDKNPRMCHPAGSSASQLDDTVPVFLSTEGVINVAVSTSTPVLGDCVDHTVISSDNVHYGPLSEIQLDDTVPVFPPAEETISVASSTSTPVSENHLEHPDLLSFDAGYQLLTVCIKLHRVNLLEEMICQFKDEMILNYPLKYSFIHEKDTDADGVARDVCCFLDRISGLFCRGGRNESAVPVTKMAGGRMEAVGRILAKGFLDQGYFPLRLAPAFTTAVISGEHAVSNDVLFESLLPYLRQCERSHSDCFTGRH